MATSRMTLRAAAMVVAAGLGTPAFAEGPANSGLDQVIEQCTPSRTVLISGYERPKLEEILSSPGGIKVGIEMPTEVTTVLGFRALDESYDYVDLIQAKLFRKDMPAALERQIIDVVAYSCERVLYDPEGFRTLFEGLNVWLLPRLDDSRRREMHEQACRVGNARGCFNLGLSFDQGVGGPQDKSQARALYEQACSSGHPGACLNLGNMVSNGHGGPQDPARARAHYEQACTGGAVGGCFNLGNNLRDGEGGVPDQLRARAFFEQACSSGHAGGCLNLGVMWHNGEGGQKDAARAAALFEQACEAGQDAACRNLAILRSDTGRERPEGGGSPGPGTTEAITLVGLYAVDGVNPNGSTYRGTLTVERVRDDLYRFRWTIGQQTFVGTGAFENGQIAVDYGERFPAVYSRNADGSLSGTWANGRARETLTPRR